MRSAPRAVRVAAVAVLLGAGVARVASAEEPAPAALTAPVPTHRVQPEYPEAATDGAEGDVVLALTICGDGRRRSRRCRRVEGGAPRRGRRRRRETVDVHPCDARDATHRQSHPHPLPLRAEDAAPAADPPAVAPPPPLPPTRPGPTEPPTPAGDEEPTQVFVGGHVQPRAHGPSDYQIPIGELFAVPRTNAASVLTLAPGFLLTNEGGSGHAEQVFLRGFDAHEGQDLEFTVDGVPINDPGNYHGNGYADTHFIIPELIHSVHVLEGPYAPQQGNFAVAGSADYQLGLDHRGLTTKFEYGSFNTERLVLLWGPKEGPAGTFAGAEFYTTDGFGANRQAKRGTAIGQYELAVGQKATLRINATAYFTEYNSAGIVREDDVANHFVDFYGTEDPAQSGNEASRASISATYEKRFQDIDVSQQLFVIDRTMRLRENDTGFIEDTQSPTEEPHGQRGDLIDLSFSEVSVGGRGLARWHGDVFGVRQEFEAGYYARLDQTTSQQYRVDAGSGAPYRTDADYASTLGDVGVYVDGNVHIMPWLGLRGGVRADMFLFDVLNNCAVPSVDNPKTSVPGIDISCQSQLENGLYREPFQRSTSASGALMPRGTLVLGPFQHFELTGSLGEGVRSVDPSDVAQGLSTPFISVESQDFGVAYAHDIGKTTSLTAKSVFFHTHVDQDFVFDPTAGRSTLSSGSTRTGWSGTARVLGDFFDVNANATLVRAVFDDTGDCAPYCGLLVPYVPDLVLRGDGVLFHDLPWKLDATPIRATVGYGVSYVGRRPLPYGELSDVTFLSDAFHRCRLERVGHSPLWTEPLQLGVQTRRVQLRLVLPTPRDRDQRRRVHRTDARARAFLHGGRAA